MKFWQTKDFKALQEAWYQRLEAEGFEDIEEMIAGDLLLKQNAAHAYGEMDELTIGCKESYYRILGEQVQVNGFSSEIDKVILSMFADGAKIKHICEELSKQGKRRCRGTIRYTIRKYEMRWGLREYTPKQLNKKTAY